MKLSTMKKIISVVRNDVTNATSNRKIAIPRLTKFSRATPIKKTVNARTSNRPDRETSHVQIFSNIERPDKPDSLVARKSHPLVTNNPNTMNSIRKFPTFNLDVGISRFLVIYVVHRYCSM